MSIQNVNVARFARNIEWYFFCDFQTPCVHMIWIWQVLTRSLLASRASCTIQQLFNALFIWNFWLLEKNRPIQAWKCNVFNVALIPASEVLVEVVVVKDSFVAVVALQFAKIMSNVHTTDVSFPFLPRKVTNFRFLCEIQLFVYISGRHFSCLFTILEGMSAVCLQF